MECKYCNGLIKDDAVKCKHCGEWLDPDHFLAIVNTTASFQSIQNALITNISAIVDSKLKATLAIFIPIIIFLLGGSGYLMVTSAITETMNDVRQQALQTKFITDNAAEAIEKAQQAKKTMDALQRSKYELEKAIAQSKRDLNDVIQQLQKKNDEKVAIFNASIDEIQTLKNELNTLKSNLHTLQNTTLKPAYTLLLQSQNSASEESTNTLKNRMALAKYLIQVGNYLNTTLPTKSIIEALTRANLTALNYQFKEQPTDDESYTSIMIGRDIPEHVVKLLLLQLKPFQKHFSYIRYNTSAYQNESVFIGANSKLSKEAQHQPLTQAFWQNIETKKIKPMIEHLMTVTEAHASE